MKSIPLTQGKTALVDDEDYGWLSQYKWHALKSTNTYYAERHSPMKNGKDKMILMHREILKPFPEMKTDHKDGNGLNNHRKNLRIATQSQNGANRRKTRGTSKFKGAYWYKRIRKWHAQICLNGKRIHLGYFNSEETAARAYDGAARKYFGEFALTNF